MKLKDMTVESYLQILASDAPAPGGGSASALSGAQGAALTAMAAGLTAASPKYDAESARRIQVQGLEQAQKLQEQIDRDTDAFHLVANAYKLPKSTSEEKQIRSQAIQEGTLVSTQVPLETMSLALEALKTTRDLLGSFNTNAASDLGVAALQLLAAVKGAWLNVLINTVSMKDRDRAASFQREGKAILEEAEALAGDVYRRLEEGMWQS